MDIPKSQKVLILKDPISQFKQSGQAVSESQLNALRETWQQYAETKAKLKDSEILSKKTSRQIGEAKRSGQPTESLLQSMKQYGQTNKTFQTQLDTLSDEIFNYFSSTQETRLAPKRPALPAARIHDTLGDNNPSITVSRLDHENNSDLAEWNQYVESNPASSLYHRAEWKPLIQKVFGHECYYFCARHKEQIVGVLPLVRLNSRLFGDFMVSVPYFNYGGAIANSLIIEQKLMHSANEFAETIKTGHVEYRDDIKRDALSARTDKVNMILSLPDNDESLWNSFPSKLRSQIKRAQREKTQVTIGGTECLTDFYTVFARNMRDLGTPVYSKTLFKSILQTFADSSKIIIIRHGNRPVAAAFLLGHKKTLEIPWASTINDVNHLSLNMLLYWQVLKFAIKNQYEYFDFGRSSKDAGTYRFKQQWGAQPKQLYWHYWLPGDIELPKLNPDNPKFALAIKIWQKIPIFITKIIGPFIVKNLP